jgi:hypothetical protein
VIALLDIDYGLNKLGFAVPGKQYPGILADFGDELKLVVHKAFPLISISNKRLYIFC